MWVGVSNVGESRSTISWRLLVARASLEENSLSKFVYIQKLTQNLNII